jgi:hypothetical protein
MALTTAGVSELVSSTLRNRSGEAADNFTYNNALLRFLKEKKNVKPFDGGRIISKELIYAQNGTVNSYSGYDYINITPQDTLSMAEFPLIQYAGTMTISGIELLMNDGKEQTINLVTERTSNLMGSLQNKIGVDLYGDGTGNAGKAVGGLSLLIASNPTTGIVAGIDRSLSNQLSTTWRNQKFSGVTDGGSPVTSANIQAYMEALWVKLVRFGQKPTVIFADNNYYRLFYASTTPQQRFTTGNSISAGANELMFNGCPVLLDGGFGGGCPANTMYFINTEFMFFQPHKRRNFSEIQEVKPFNQDSIIKMAGWAGALTMNNAFMQGVLIA